ncbi:MAG TPA: CocE/NonD family hydrolase [Thermoanaerobaculia bacterium]
MTRHRRPRPFHRPATLAAAAFLFLLGSVAAPAPAASPAEGHVSEASPSVSWSGATFAAAANTGASTAGCFGADGRPLASPVTSGPDACDAFTLWADLDPSFWDGQTGGVEVRIDMGAADDFDLYVHRRNADGTIGDRVDASESGTGLSEVAVLPAASGGYYVVVTGWAVAAGGYQGTAALAASGSSGTRIRSGRSVSSYLHDVSEPDPTITVTGSIVEQHRVEVEGGFLIDSWIVRPPVPEPVPVVLQVTPYWGGGSPVSATSHSLGRIANELVPRGYAFGLVSVRGTGSSEGCFTIGGPSEARDTAAVIEHYAAQPWSNGKVGLVGVSYDGTTPQDAWVEAPPSLATIVPIAGISDLYKYNFVNGVPIVVQGFAFNTYYWGLVGLSPVGLAGGEQIRDPVSVPGAIAGEVCPEQVWVQEGGVSSTVDGDKDGYWQLRDFHRELLLDPDRERASVFYIHGLADWNVKPHNMEDWLAAVQGTGVPFKAWLGQWGHAYPDRADWWTVLAAWFDRFLKGRDTGILDAPAVQVKTDRGDWRHEERWPPAAKKDGLRELVLHPSAGGVLGEGPGGGEASYYDYQGRLATPLEQAVAGPDRVEFVSAPLAKDLHLGGLPRFEGTVVASGHRASLMLTLVERTPSGDRALNYAAQSLNHVSSLAGGATSIAGVPQRVTVDFFPQDDVVRAGSRLVLVAAGNLVRSNAAGPDLQPVADGSVVTLELGDARLVLPTDRSVTYEEE